MNIIRSIKKLFKRDKEPVKPAISQEAAEQFFLNWVRNIDEEISFWNEYLKTGGLDCPEDYQNRLNIKSVSPNITGFRIIEDFAARYPSDHIKILDVGAGPMSCTAHYLPGKKVDMTACDPLAPAYEAILDKYNIQPPVKTVVADGENLSSFFDKNVFDIASARNSLDHSYHPIQCILQMFHLIKKGGIVALAHSENEGEWGSYHGLHQWNFSGAEDGDMIIWNKDTHISLKAVLGDCAMVKTTTPPLNSKRRWVRCRIEKVGELSAQQRAVLMPNTLHIKYAALMAEFMRSKISQIAS